MDSFSLYHEGIGEKGFRVNPWGVLPFDYVRKRFGGFNRFRGFNRDGAAHKKQKRRGVLKYALFTKYGKPVNLLNLQNLFNL